MLDQLKLVVGWNRGSYITLGLFLAKLKPRILGWSVQCTHSGGMASVAHKQWVAPYQIVGKDSHVVGSPGPIVGQIHLIKKPDPCEKVLHQGFGTLGHDGVD